MLGRGGAYEHLIDRHIELRHPRQASARGEDELGYQSNSTDSEYALFREEEARNKRWKDKSRGIRPSVRELPLSKGRSQNACQAGSKSQRWKTEMSHRPEATKAEFPRRKSPKRDINQNEIYEPTPKERREQWRIQGHVKQIKNN